MFRPMVRRLLNAGDEFHALRDYVQGDDLRMIHWPTTARRNKIVVRQHELPPEIVSEHLAELERTEYARAREVWARRFGKPPVVLD